MKVKIVDYLAKAEDQGKSIRELAKDKFNISNRIFTRVKNNKGILVDGNVQSANCIVKLGSHIEFLIEDEASENIVPEKMDINIVYEDEDILVVNKPSGIVVHPTTYNFTGTLANGIMHYFSEKDIDFRFRPVFRLDKDTSGLILIAKNQLSHYRLSNQLIEHSFKKEYIAIAENKFDNLIGVIDLPIARKPGSIIERMVSEDGQEAITKYEVIKQNEKGAVLNINLHTGRTHQIRVHMSHIGHPLYGDELYGGNREYILRQALHCSRISFIHPTKEEDVTFYCEMPEDMALLIKKLGL